MYQNQYSGKYCQKRIRFGFMQLLYAVNIALFLASTICLFGQAHMHRGNLGLLPTSQITVVEAPW